MAAGPTSDVPDLARRDAQAVEAAGAHAATVTPPDDAAGPRRVAPASVAEAPREGDAAGTPMLLPHPDWLHHGLVVSGPMAAVAAFRHAAA